LKTVCWQIIAINGDGTIVPNFIYSNAVVPYGQTSVFASPAAADLDNNGKVDLVWATGKSTNGLVVTNGIIHIWELGDYNPHANPWPMFKRTGTRTSAYTLQFENPIFEPSLLLVKARNLMKVSIDVHAGLSGLSNVNLSLKINGSLVQTNMLDDGTNGDANAGDRRYTGTVQLPVRLNSISDISFTAEANNGETAQWTLEWSKAFALKPWCPGCSLLLLM